MSIEISSKGNERYMNWFDAMEYCQSINIDGYGWRLPTKDELENMIDKHDLKPSFYWSSDDNNKNFAYGRKMVVEGTPFMGYYDKSFTGYVRPVRNIVK